MKTISTDYRLLLEVPLVPAIGDRFQPTGFPDLGHAVYDIPDGRGGTRQALLVESAQSMANRLEAVGWDLAHNRPQPTIEGLPYIRVVHGESGDYLTSSRTEAHRIASAFVKDSTLDGTPMRTVIRTRLNLREERPLAAREIAAAVFDLDPLCLLHGVFFVEDAKTWPGQPKIARAVTAFVEAFDVKPAHSGGVKRDHVRHSLQNGDRGTPAGYGSVPFHRTEWTADRIVARFSVDRAQIRSYGLGETKTRFLENLALWQIRSLLTGGLRLRTACDLFPAGTTIADQSGQSVPPLDELDAAVRAFISEAGAQQPLEVRWARKSKG